MVPGAFVTLPALPLSPNGKVDRKALPAPGGVRQEAGFTAPRTPLEEQVAAIWAEVLKLDRVGLHDRFWDLGGHSLLATKVLVRLRHALGVDLPLQTLFEHPTLEAFATAVGHAVLAGHEGEMESLLQEVANLSEEEILALLQQDE